MTNNDRAAHEAHDAYVHAINSNRLDSFLEVVTDDIVFLPPNSPAISGRASVREWVQGYFDAYETKWEKTSKEFVVRDDWAYEWYEYKSVDTPRADGPAAGTPVVADSGNGINIYRRGDGGVWRVARDGWASDRPLQRGG
jgi:ketosteroid isomerase-like protein